MSKTQFRENITKMKVFESAQLLNKEALLPTNLDSFSQKNNVKSAVSKLTITLLIPFEQGHAAWKMYDYMKAESEAAEKTIKMKETSLQSLDFYEGLQYALREQKPFFDVKINVYDSQNNDSLLRETLKN